MKGRRRHEKALRPQEKIARRQKLELEAIQLGRPSVTWSLPCCTHGNAHSEHEASQWGTKQMNELRGLIDMVSGRRLVTKVVRPLVPSEPG